METIVLTGMMGAGKSTVGQILAQQLQVEFVDIDSLIEKQENKSIAKIFEISGEDYFRTLEKNMIKNSFKPQNQILSLGGGAFENPETQEFLISNSTVIYLKASPETILERVKNNNSRPLLNNNNKLQKITEIINIRKQNYEKAHYIITTDNKNPNEVANEITGVISND